MKRFLTMMAMASISMMTMAQSTLGSGLNVADFDKSVRPGMSLTSTRAYVLVMISTSMPVADG